jgi:hypothetical protein
MQSLYYKLPKSQRRNDGAGYWLMNNFLETNKNEKLTGK